MNLQERKSAEKRTDIMESSERVFKIPEFEYFSMGGKYSGCKRGMKLDDFSFRITPGEKITVHIWYDVKCFELSETVAESEFELTRDGYLAACLWIEEQYKEWLKEHSVRSNELGYFAPEPELPEWFKQADNG